MKPARIIPVLLSCLFTTACSDGGDTPLPDYLTRLGRSLEMNISPTREELPALPRARELHIDLAQGSLDLLDMFALNDCQLNVTIGKSNSSLGKLASGSQRLLLELEFLSLAPACIRTLESGDHVELAKTLKLALSGKRQQLPARIWNATFAGPEFREFWSQPSSLAKYPGATGPAVPAALEELATLFRAWLTGGYQTGHDRLEPLLGIIRTGDGGSLLSGLAVQRSGLDTGTAALHQRLGDPPLCYENRPGSRGRILETVVRKFFIGEVQPWSVELARRRQLLLEPITEMEAALEEVTPSSYSDWRRRRDSLLSSSIEAPRQHALAIAALLDQCGLRPGGQAQ